MQILDYIEIESTDQIGFITLNRPEARNALDEKMLSEIEQAYSQFEKDSNVRIIVFQGASEKEF